MTEPDYEHLLTCIDKWCPYCNDDPPVKSERKMFAERLARALEENEDILDALAA